MINNEELYLINKIFYNNLNLYKTYKDIEITNFKKEVVKIYNSSLDMFYDSMDQMLEILDDCGANK